MKKSITLILVLLCVLSLPIELAFARGGRGGRGGRTAGVARSGGPKIGVRGNRDETRRRELRRTEERRSLLEEEHRRRSR